MTSTLTMEQKVGQRMAIGFSGTSVSDKLRYLVKTYKIGNVILFRENLADANQLKQLCHDIKELVLQETGILPFITIDQEGGVVTRLPPDMITTPGAMALASTENPEAVYQAARITIQQLREIGVNFNLAPVLDVNCNHQNPVIGVRSYGDTPQTVVANASSALRAYQQEHFLCCAKHFPGHGDTAVDSHLAMPVVDKNLDQLNKMELFPFKKAVELGIPAIMTSHILFPQLEKEKLPATMSRTIITGLLKETLGFKGLVLSDGMEMNAIKAEFGTPKGCAMAVKAGVDIVFVCHDPDSMEQSAQAILKAWQTGLYDKQEFDSSVEKILQYKQIYLADQKNSSGLSMLSTAEMITINKQLTQDTIRVVENTQPQPLGSKPFFAGCLAYRSTIATTKADTSLSFAAWFERHMGGTGLETPQNPTEQEIQAVVDKIDNFSSIIYACYNAHLNKGQLALAQALIQTAKKKKIPATIIALRDPYDLKNLDNYACKLAAFEYTEKSFEALKEVLSQKYSLAEKKGLVL